ncbi:probable serine/threonine-protein kinase DDB_G0271682 isoform X1 [Stylophora pistillata]|uniref:probable serine/threonine-protein kinase DDB_G0271682 isoform X1 n=1 Tax=Stylophora pistillata TaxID=50429 RepID=UPI000C03DAEE|nr:probable serine/threonine-protein kinase DDB_G0271682 isoform X1 [Stylophora pistillata]
MGQRLTNFFTQGRQRNAREQTITELREELRAQITYRQNQEQTITELRGELRAQITYRQNQEQTITELRGELRAKEQHLTYLQRQFNTRDWVISRNEIYMEANEVLGEGAWGRVVRGKFRRCVVAVKKIHELLSPQAKALFEQEISIASRCRHPCLLQFIGATDDDRPLLVMELMDRSLRSLYEERHLTEREISFISLDVALALNYLHQYKPDPIIHRDISSANVLLWKERDQWRAKVSDYGTANFVRLSTNDGPGALIYCAPEVRGTVEDRVISCKIDVYSFGVLLCEISTGQLPDPERRQQQVDLVNNFNYQAVIQRCLEPDAGMRANMEQIIDELETFRLLENF